MHDQITIKLRLDHNVTYVDGRLCGSVYKEFKKALGYYPEGSMWMIENVRKKKEKAQLLGQKTKYFGEWDGLISTVCYSKEHCKCFKPKSGTHFPTGLISKAIHFFKDYDINYTIEDIRNKYEMCPGILSMSSDYESRDYQEEVVQEALKKTRGVIQIATGGGKTPVAADIISKIGLFPVVFYVTSKDLLWQAKSELERFILKDGKNIEVGVIGDGKKDIKDINIITVQTSVVALGGTYKKFDDEDRKQQVEDFYKNDNEIINLIKNAKVMVADEIQHWASETCQMISDASENCQYKFGISATVFRDLNDDILIEGCFGKKIIDINASYLIKKKYLVKPEILFVHIDNIKKSKYRKYTDIYKYGIVHNDLRNNWIKDIVKTLSEQNRNILILCKQIKHGNILESLIPNSFFLHGSHSNKQRKEHLDKMRENKVNITIASVIFDEGINVKSLDSLVLAGAGKSQTRALQRIGRTLRSYPGKENAIIIDFYDDCKFLRDHSEKRRKIYMTEPEFVIKDAYQKRE